MTAFDVIQQRLCGAANDFEVLSYARSLCAIVEPRPDQHKPHNEPYNKQLTQSWSNERTVLSTTCYHQ